MSLHAILMEVLVMLQDLTCMVKNEHPDVEKRLESMHERLGLLQVYLSHED